MINQRVTLGQQIPLPLVMILTPAVVGIASFSAYRFLSPIDDKFADIVAGFILTGLVPVYKYFRNVQIQLDFLASQEGEVSLNRFTLSWYLMIVYGGLILLGTLEISAALASFLVAVFVPITTDILFAVQILSAVIIFPIFAFAFGLWTGKKCNRYGWLVVPVTILLVRLIDLALLFMIPASVIQESYNATKTALFMGLLSQTGLTLFAVTSLIQVFFGLLGYRRGRRERFAGYLQDLFSILAPDTQKTLVQMAYDEAQRLSPSRQNK